MDLKVRAETLINDLYLYIKDSSNPSHFKTLLIKFLREDHSLNDQESTNTTNENEQKTKVGWFQNLGQEIKKEIDPLYIEREKISFLSTFKISSTINFTLMQYATNIGSSDFIKIMLDEGLDPNHPIRSEENINDKFNDDHDELLPPVLLAAKKGHSHVLRLLKQHNHDVKASESLIQIDVPDQILKNIGGKNEDEMQSIGLRSMYLEHPNDIVRHPCNFSVWSSNGETVLHFLLKEPLAQRIIDSGIFSADEFKVPGLHEEIVNKRRRRRLEMREKHEKCLQILLSENPLSRFHEEQMKYENILN